MQNSETEKLIRFETNIKYTIRKNTLRLLYDRKYIKMIDNEATFKKFGYYANELKPKSGKRIIAICDKCGKVREIYKHAYKDLCRSCSHKGKKFTNKHRENLSKAHINKFKGKNSPHYGKPKSKEHKQKMSESAKIKIFTDEHKANISKATKGENNPFYGKHHTLESKIKNSCTSQGINREDWDGFKTRDHILPEWKCTKLNKRFNNCNMHHITQSIIIYIPKELHEHIPHNLKNGSNMGSINMLALQFINGGL